MTQIQNPKSEIRNLEYGDHLRFGKLLLDCCGLHFPEKRRSELELAVRHAFAASICANLDEYYRLLQDPEKGTLEMDRLINAATVGETHFFRNTAQFDALYYHVLPELIEHKRHLRTLRVWSAGCASGEEPYSIAMLLRELLPDVDQWSITILGTDINTEALDRARRAVYGGWAFREERARRWQSRYFRPQGKRYELVPEVQRMVTFARLNLTEPGYPSYQTNTMFMDLILCRNVTIYFSQYVTLEVVERLYNALMEGGWLVVGHSEPSMKIYRRFQVRNFPNAILYQRVAQPAALSPDWSTDQLSVSSDRLPVISYQLPVTSHQLPATSNQQPATTDPIEYARELLEFGRSEEARDVLLKAVKSVPERAPAYALLGQVYANLGCWQEAEDWCRGAVGLNKLTLEAYYTLSLVLQHLGKLDQAIDAMKKVVYLNREHVLGHFGLASLYHDNCQWPQAQKSLDNARRLLEARPADQVIPGSGGVTAGRLHEAVIRHHQAWSGECET